MDGSEEREALELKQPIIDEMGVSKALRPQERRGSSC